MVSFMSKTVWTGLDGKEMIWQKAREWVKDEVLKGCGERLWDVGGKVCNRRTAALMAVQADVKR